jgi:hypothetical protein
MRARIIAVIVIVFVGTGVVHGDGGMIPFRPHVSVFEPNQNALIAWNGQEEILILSTDTYASEPTKGLEVIPLKSEPTVQLGDPNVFDKATSLINSWYDRRFSQSRPVGGPAFGGAPPSGGPPMAAPPAGEVTQHETIGRHEIAVTHVLNENGFCTWAEEYLRSQGVDTPVIPDRLRTAIQGYLKRGFNWFVYDVVELSDTVHTNAPIQFRFKSDCVFYPLVITQTESLKVKIRILVITPEYLREYPELPRENIRVGLEEFLDPKRIAEEMVILSRTDMHILSPEINELLDYRDGMKLRIWTLIPEKMRGRFIHDLVAR